ncbi:MAG: VWA domain-containing protein [Actinomycetota bacterium]
MPDILFDHPGRLWLLIAIAVLLVVYVGVQRQRGQYALRFSDTSLLDAVAPNRPGWRRHLVAVLFLATGGLMVASFAGPHREVIPFRATIVLTIDTSLSMGANDVDPTRLEAAKAAALDFLSDVPDSVDVALISFDEFPVVQVAPTADRREVRAAVRSLELGPFTATGDAIAASVQALRDTGRPIVDDAGDPTSVVVLLSAGEPTIGRDIDDAIAEAVASQVQINTVAFGTALGEVELEDPEFPGTTTLQPVPVDELTMETVALATGGEFYSTDSFTDLAEIYRDLGTALAEEPIREDLHEYFMGFALVAAGLTATLSLLWFQRLP